MPNHRLLVFTVCAVALLSTIGAALPYPILAPLFAAGQANGLNHFAGLPPKLLLSAALAVNPVGLLIGSALLGPLSDRYGRRAMLLATALVCALGHMASAGALISENYPLFLLTRLITGLAQGNAVVARAMLADELDGQPRIRAFAWLNGSLYSGWLIGPLLAGATVQLGNSVPFELAATFLAFTLLLGLTAFPADAASRPEGGFWHTVRERHTFMLLADPELRKIFLLYLAYCFGVTAFYEFYPLWLVEFIGLHASGISLVTALLCVLMTATSALVGRGWATLTSTQHLRRYALLAAGCIALTALGGPHAGLLALVAFGIPNALYNAILPVYCSERFADHGQGAVMGLLTTTFCLANVLVTLAGAGVTLIDTRLMLLLGASCSAWAGWHMARWASHGSPAPTLAPESNT